MKNSLSESEEQFCAVYARCFDGAKAYAYAFDCDFEKARAEADALLEKKKIRDRIAAIKKAKFDHRMIEIDDIVDMYIKIAFADLTDFLEFGKKSQTDEDSEEKSDLTLRENPKADTAAISSLTSSKGSVKLTFYDRMKALEWLGKHFGLGDAAEDCEGGVVIVPDVESALKSLKEEE